MSTPYIAAETIPKGEIVYCHGDGTISTKKSHSTIRSSRLAVSEALKGYRDCYGLKQTQLAAKLGVSVRTLQRWESGDTRPWHKDDLARIKAFFDKESRR